MLGGAGCANVSTAEFTHFAELYPLLASAHVGEAVAV